LLWIDLRYGSPASQTHPFADDDAVGVDDVAELVGRFISSILPQPKTKGIWHGPEGVAVIKLYPPI